MKTREFNLQNWTGETTVVDFNKKGEFSFYDYNFQVVWEVFKESKDASEGCLKVLGDGWNDELTTLFLFAEDGDVQENGAPTLERMVIAAVRYIANHV